MNHKIKINNIEVELTEEQIIELHSRLQNKGERYFFPEENEEYYCLTSQGVNKYCDMISQIDRGVYRTNTQAKKEDEKRKALVRMWKWVQENGLFFEPNWNDIKQTKKYVLVFDYNITKWRVQVYHNHRYDFMLPQFKSESDCQKFIDNNLSDLNLFV